MDRLMRMIPEENLSLLDNYSFHSVSPTYLDGIFSKIWWTPMADLLPKWLSPNSITLMSATCIFFVNYSLFAHIPDLECYRAPGWVPLTIAFMLFLYMTFDGIDGKQARKLGVSSPLGQLMDHGVDAVISVFYAYMCFTIAPGGFSFPIMLMVGVAPLHVLASVWRESEFSTFCCANGVIGVTETNLGSILIQLIVYFFKPRDYNRIIYRFSPAVMSTFIGKITPGYIDLYSVGIWGLAIMAYFDWICGFLRIASETKKPWACTTFFLAAVCTVYPSVIMAYTLPKHLKVLGCLFASSVSAVVCVNNIVCLLCKSQLYRFHLGLIPHYICLLHYFAVPFLKDLGVDVSDFALSQAEFHYFLRAVTIYGFGYLLFVFFKTSHEICVYLNIPFLAVPEKANKK